MKYTTIYICDLSNVNNILNNSIADDYREIKFNFFHYMFSEKKYLGYKFVENGMFTYTFRLTSPIKKIELQSLSILNTDELVFSFQR